MAKRVMWSRMVAAAALALLLSSCGGGGGGSGGSATDTQTTARCDSRARSTATVCATFPSAGASQISAAAKIYVKFHSSTDALTVTNAQIVVTDSLGDVLGGSTVASGIRKDVLWTPAELLEYGEQYTVSVQVPAPAARGMTTLFSWTFSTASSADAPAVVLWGPLDESFPVNGEVWVKFDRPMNPDSLNPSTFYIDGVAGEVRYEPGEYKAYFTPHSDLYYSSHYLVVLEREVVDQNGAPLAAPHEWELMTEAMAGSSHYYVGGYIHGFQGQGLVLNLDNGDQQTLTSDGTDPQEFTFDLQLPAGAPYTASVHTQPSSPRQDCTLVAGTESGIADGTLGIQISCVTFYSVGGTVAGLISSGLTLELVDQRGDGTVLTVPANVSSFEFTEAVRDLESFTITKLADPTGQTCSVSPSTGTINGASQTHFSVSCSNIPYTGYMRLNNPASYYPMSLIVRMEVFDTDGTTSLGYEDVTVTSAQLMSGHTNVLYPFSSKTLYVGQRYSFSIVQHPYYTCSFPGTFDGTVGGDNVVVDVQC